MMNYFSTSMMCADVFRLQEQIKTIETYTDFYHIDVMDGHFVPNLTLSFDYIKALRKRTKKPIDAHLMMTNPGEFVDLLLEIGVDYITFHPRTIQKDVFRIIKKCKENQVKFGVALSPSIGLEAIQYYKKHVDKITIMTVEPGFAGQAAIPEAIEKIKEVYAYRQAHHLDFLIEVDGSNNFSTFETYKQHGTDVFILGSTLFKEEDLEKSYQKIIQFIEDIHG